MTALLVAIGAAVGAPLRYLTDRFIARRRDTVFPWGTLAVNVGGSLVLGVVAGLAGGGRASSHVVALAGTGFCGALTTYSTFGYETVRLVEDGAWFYGVLNALASVALGLAAVWGGYAIAS